MSRSAQQERLISASIREIVARSSVAMPDREPCAEYETIMAREHLDAMDPKRRAELEREWE